MRDTSLPSNVRVFSKALHLLAAGWTVCIAVLLVAEVRQRAGRDLGVTADSAMPRLVEGALPILALEAMAMGIAALAGAAPEPAKRRREWRRAVWWSAGPNLLLLTTALFLALGGG